MANKMLIDASHPEETRVVVVRGSRIEEFDFESEHKKQIKGNIYLAKVTRVEPSLQAAFVDYGGNRHGFLAFSEIHPDYYQIPVADRQALVEDELARVREEEEYEERKLMRARPRPAAADGASGESIAESADGDDASDGEASDETDAHSHDDDNTLSENEHEAPELMGDGPDDGHDDGSEDGEQSADASESAPSGDDGDHAGGGRRRGRRSRSRGRGNAEDAPGSDDEVEEVDDLGAEDAMEEVPIRQPRAPRKQYKIQEVIKRRQILLVQVVKEERGNKGAALTTYLSLAGRYSVLMPNTARGGGISRKITNIADRKRLKEVARDLEVPRGMGIILRTAGAMRTKAEVKRDYEYLMRLWETVRSLTLSSTAPTLVYEEGSLIKRSIRDLYNKDIDQILVSGEDGYREAKDFMRMLMPSQAKVVQPYRDAVPIFARGGIEAQLDRMLQPHVTLKSGGYIIINQTEALVAIDVNSGRSTREHSIEDTAFQTNMEAAEEVARQLRLRDLAGLIVIDFIDMEEKRNNRTVEKKIKDCLKDDRARIQVGRISHFGLMEMSRQRIRASVLESTTQTCPVCNGVGHIRSASSLALNVVRTIEEHLQKSATHDLIVKVPTATALYVLNEKRGTIHEMEANFGLRITIEADEAHGHQSVIIEHGAEAVRPVLPLREVVNPLTIDAGDEFDEIEAVAEVEETEEPEVTLNAEGTDEDRRRKRRRRRRGRSGEETVGAEGEDREAEAGEALEAADEAPESVDDGEESPSEDGDGEAAPSDDEGARLRKRRRRGRRGGRKNREGGVEGASEDGEDGDDEGEEASVDGALATESETAPVFEPETESSVPEIVEAPFAPSDGEVRAAANDDATTAPVQTVAVEEATDEPEVAAAPERFKPEMPEPATPEPELPEPETPEPEMPEPATPEPETSEPETSEPQTSEPEQVASAETSSQPTLVESVSVVEGPPAEPQVTSNGQPAEETGEAKPKRTGWWARRNFF